MKEWRIEARMHMAFIKLFCPMLAAKAARNLMFQRLFAMDEMMNSDFKLALAALHTHLQSSFFFNIKHLEQL